MYNHYHELHAYVYILFTSIGIHTYMHIYMYMYTRMHCILLQGFIFYVNNVIECGHCTTCSFLLKLFWKFVHVDPGISSLFILIAQLSFILRIFCQYLLKIFMYLKYCIFSFIKVLCDVHFHQTKLTDFAIPKVYTISNVF